MFRSLWKICIRAAIAFWMLSVAWVLLYKWVPVKWTPLMLKRCVQNVKVEIDEKLLSEIAESTGGRYFRATDNTKLAEIYSEINKMEKARTTIDSFPIYKELFGLYALLALLAILLELLLNWFVIRRLP